MKFDEDSYPVDCSDFPDLSSLGERGLRVAFSGRAIIGALPIREDPGRGYVFNLVRLAEKASESYSACRAGVAAWTAAGISITHMMRAIDNAETCVNATHRGFLFANALRRVKADESADPIVTANMQGQLRAARAQIDRLRVIRDAIEHRGADLASGKNPGAGPYLVLRQLGLHLGERSFTYKDLASVVSTLHSFTCDVVRPEETHSAPATPPDAPS